MEAIRLWWRAHRAMRGPAELFIGAAPEAQVAAAEAAMGRRCEGVPWGAAQWDGRHVPLLLLRLTGHDWVQASPVSGPALAPGWLPVAVGLRLGGDAAMDALARGTQRPCMFLAALNADGHVEAELERARAALTGLCGPAEVARAMGIADGVT